MKRAIIVHGYKGTPDTNWKPWLKDALEAEGYATLIPAMPTTNFPIASEWQAKLTESVGQPTPDLYLIGHSLGTITILRYLESLTENQQVGGAVLIAGFGERHARYVEGSHDTFFDHELDWERIKQHCPNITAIHSDTDPHIDLSQLVLFESKLGAKTTMLPNMGHFGSADGMFEAPFVLDAIHDMTK